MIIKKLSLDRRTLLRGLGAGVALPLLDAMEPALARAADKVAPVKRFGVAYTPNGMSMDYWTPKTTGALQLTPIMQPLEPFHDRLLAISGMNAPSLTASSPHSRSSTDFLTGTPPGKAPGGGGMTSISIDQMIAKSFGQQTQLPSLELGLDNIDGAGLCDANPCIMGNAISWHTPTLPLPPENNPRMVFERLFGDVGSTETAARLAHMRQDRSILDFVTAESADLRRQLGPEDRARLAEYLDGVRDIENSHPEGRGPERQGNAPGQSAGGHSGDLRGARQADVRSAGAGLSGRPDAGDHLHVRPRIQRPSLSGNRRSGGPPPPLPPPERSAEAGPAGQDQHLSRADVRLFPGQAEQDQGGRRLAARPQPADLRRGHERQQSALPDRHSGDAGRRPQSGHQGRAAPDVRRRTARPICWSP